MKATIRVPLIHHASAGKLDPHVGVIHGDATWIHLPRVDADTGRWTHRWHRVVLRQNPDNGQWINITLARSGNSITSIVPDDYRDAGVAPGSRARPRLVAQAAIRRLCKAHGTQLIADSLAYAEQAGPVVNPETLGHRIYYATKG